MASEKIILGEGCVYDSNPKVTGVNRNVVAVGGSGSGKTFSIVTMELLETLRAEDPMNRIVVCTKRNIRDLFIPAFQRAGFRVYNLDFANPVQSNCAFDPLYYVHREEDMEELARNIIMANPQKERSNADPFWDDTAISLLNAEIGLARFLKRHPTFDDVLRIHAQIHMSGDREDFTTELDEYFQKMEEAHENSYTMQCWKTFRQAPFKTASTIYTVMTSTLRAFTPDIRTSIAQKPPINFERFCQEKSILFVTTSPVKKSLHMLANMFVGQAIAELYTIAEKQPGAALRVPVHISFDDFATGARVSEMPEKISIFREKGISCTLLLQSESQLEKMYGPYGAMEILDNCDSYVFFGGNNLRTAQSVSTRLNVPVDDILYMPVGEEIIFRRGCRPVRTTRWPVSSDLLYQSIQYEIQDHQPYKADYGYRYVANA